MTGSAIGQGCQLKKKKKKMGSCSCSCVRGIHVCLSVYFTFQVWVLLDFFCQFCELVLVRFDPDPGS